MPTPAHRSPRFVLATNVRFTRNSESSAPLIFFDSGRVLQLGTDLGLACESIAAAQQPLDETDLARRLINLNWSDSVLHTALQTLLSAGIVCAVSVPDAFSAAGPRRRIERRPSLTLRLTVFNPELLCWVLSPLARLFQGQLGLRLSLGGATLQILCLVLAPAATQIDPSSRRPLLVIALLLATAVWHELAHGIVLADAGGRPQRMGIMLFYLAPSFFCDISDSFRLGRQSQIRVALAGVMAQTQLGALVAPFIFAPGLTGSSSRLYVGLNLFILTVNLMPFIALDGYFALRAAVGIPDLRSIAMRACVSTIKEFISSSRRHDSQHSLNHLSQHLPVLFRSHGSTMPSVRTSNQQLRSTLSSRRWLVAYGAAAALTPVLVVPWSVCSALHRLLPTVRVDLFTVVITVAVIRILIAMLRQVSSWLWETWRVIVLSMNPSDCAISLHAFIRQDHGSIRPPRQP
jgi:hypothetical protein